MKHLLTLLILFISSSISFGQNNEPKEITPQILQKITTEVDKEASRFRQSVSSKGLTADAIEFAVDTFKIAHICSKRMDTDYSTTGMNLTIEEMTASYDKLLNKYYNKLLKTLLPDDKKSLIKAQRSWINYRDAEMELIRAMTKDNYSGGGTMQSIVATEGNSNLIARRTAELFDYYNAIEK